MNNKDYQVWAIKKERRYDTLTSRLNTRDFRLMHASMGLSGEAGELIDTIKKHIFYNKPLDVKNIKEEAGDILWYIAIILDQVDSSFDEVMKLNQDKLEARYPSGFTEQAAKDRADKK